MIEMSISAFGGTMGITTGGFLREYCNERFVRYDNGSEIYRNTSGSSSAGQGASLEVIDEQGASMEVIGL